MLTNRLLIDGQDAYTTYGLVLQEGSYAALVQMPQYKSVTTNDWHEEDAIEADLSAPVLDSRRIELRFYVVHHIAESQAQLLFERLKNTVHHTFTFVDLAVEHKLRLVSTSSYDVNSRFDTITLSFAEDVVDVPNASTPTVPTVRSLGYTIDDIDFSFFGCLVTKGTRASLLRFSDPKEALSVSTCDTPGVTYDSGDTIRLKTRDITINMNIHTRSVAEFWGRWNSLFAIVLSAGQKTIEGDDMIFSCYYKSNKVSRFILLDSGEVWCDFTITFAVLSYSRGDEWYYLATQDDYPVTFQDQGGDDPLYVRIRI